LTIIKAELAAVVTSHCSVLGVALDYGQGAALDERKRHDHTASLDRVIPERGYVAGNIAVISFRANACKSDATLAEIERIATWLEVMHA
jgi:hypothetical protein